ncbi:hypothetical protein C9I28_12665 [Pseudoduganella armeniaca]|uniref:Uncharacterized protein n=1 Tax=Pseudoduganella armeniaca TaxID=2072590 RepID=A0A2R4CA46_9BURK|nr:hypothetical protein C9I28_12665 [Pseudoduganella armeniaca]
MQHTSWTASNGAPTGITAIAQTPDGWLWIGGAAGLFRFDGARFERARDIGLEPLSSSITNLGVLPDGTLWLVYKYGGASLLANGRMRHFRVGEHGTPAGSISGLAQDGAGRLWLGTSGGGLREMSAAGVWRAPAAAMAAPAAPSRRCCAIATAYSGCAPSRVSSCCRRAPAASNESSMSLAMAYWPNTLTAASGRRT